MLVLVQIMVLFTELELAQPLLVEIEDFYFDWTRLLSIATPLGAENQWSQWERLSVRYARVLRAVDSAEDHFAYLFGSALLYHSHYASLDRLMQHLASTKSMAVSWLQTKIAQSYIMHPDLVAAIVKTGLVSDPRLYRQSESESYLVARLWHPEPEEVIVPHRREYSWQQLQSKNQQYLVEHYKLAHIFHHLRHLYNPTLVRLLLQSHLLAHHTNSQLRQGNLWSQGCQWFWLAQHFNIPLHVCHLHQWVSIADDSQTSCILCAEMGKKLCTRCKFRAARSDNHYRPIFCKECDYIAWKDKHPSFGFGPN